MNASWIGTSNADNNGGQPDDFRSGAVFITSTCPGGPFTGTARLKPAGVWVRERIRTPDNFPTS